MSAEKKMSIGFLSVIILSVFLFIGLCLYYDPIHIFRMPKTGTIYFDDNARLQLAAFIRHFEFDSIILGNSYMENTSSEEASRKLGGKFFNLSLSGSNNFERAFILSACLKKHSIKKVVLLLSEGSLSPAQKNYDLSNWTFLYDGNPINDFQVYANKKFISYVKSKLLNKPAGWGTTCDLDRPYAWYKINYFSKRFGGLKNWGIYHDTPQLKHFIDYTLPNMMKTKIEKNKEPALQTKQEIEEYLNKTIFNYVKKHPETRFYCYYNPDSMLQISIRLRDQSFGRLSYFIRRTAELGEQFPNFYFFGFSTLPFVSDLANYKDTHHYRSEINSDILTMIQNDKCRLSIKNVDNYLHELEEKGKQFDIIAVHNTIQKYINDNK